MRQWNSSNYRVVNVMIEEVQSTTEEYNNY